MSSIEWAHRWRVWLATGHATWLTSPFTLAQRKAFDLRVRTASPDMRTRA